MNQSKFQSASPSEAQMFAFRPRSMSVSSTSTQIITEEGKNRPGPTLLKDHNNILHQSPKVLSKLEQHVNYVFATALKNAPYLSQQYHEWLKGWATKVVTRPSEVPESTVAPDNQLKKQIYSYAKIIHDDIVEEEKYWAEYGELESGMTSCFHRWCDKHNDNWRHSSGAWTLWRKIWSESIIERIDIDRPITRLWKQCLDEATNCLGFDRIPDHACYFIIENSNSIDNTAQSMVPNESSRRKYESEAVEDTTTKEIKSSRHINEFEAKEETTTKEIKSSVGNNVEVQDFHPRHGSMEIFERLRQVETSAEEVYFETSEQKVWAWMEDWSKQSAEPVAVVSPTAEIEALTSMIEALAIADGFKMEGEDEYAFRAGDCVEQRIQASMAWIALQRNNAETELFTWFGETDVDNLVSS